MKTTILITLALLSMVSCDVKKEGLHEKENSQLQLPEWAHNATIYEANVRHMTDKGDFKSLESHLERIKDMGIDIVWLMPIHPISEVKRKATGDKTVAEIEDADAWKKYLGSPYSVADYRKVNPDYGTMDDFKRLLAETHRLGMKLIIDWVPNHTGWDHPWIEKHPDWYTQDSLGNIIDPVDYNTGKSWGWTDVADLNYDNREMRRAMIESMLYWINEIGIDGFRMDVAHGVPQDFWNEATPELVSANPDIFLLAESARPSNLNEQTFHADYAWSFHHIMNEIAQGKSTVEAVYKWLEEDSTTFNEGFHMHFTSNHDENTWAGTVFERMGDAHKAMAVLSATLDGMPLLYSGMEEPLRKRLAFFTKDTIGFSDYAYADFYKTLFDLKHRNKALWNGDYGGEVRLLGRDKQLLAFMREKEGDKVLVVINLGESEITWKVSERVEMNNVFGGDDIVWEEGMEIPLGPWAYYVFSNK